MPDMLEEFARETIDKLLKDLPIEKRLEGLTPEQLRELADKLEANGTIAKPEDPIKG